MRARRPVSTWIDLERALLDLEPALLDLVAHRLKDLEHTERLCRLIAPGIPDEATPVDTTEQVEVFARAAGSRPLL